MTHSLPNAGSSLRLGSNGRFAPTPSGPLHFGSLVVALGSYLQARCGGGQWWLRIDDLDTPRVLAGAADDILRTLEGFGFEWDGAVQYQSAAQSQQGYRAAFARLQAAGLLYGCACSRQDLAQAPRALDGAVRYPATCRHTPPAAEAIRAWRIRVEGEAAFADAVQGLQRVCLATEMGDFILARADGFFAWHLAAVVDDAALGVAEVVRGTDLLASSLRQVFLHHCLALPVPRYVHLPLALAANGDKLSKKTAAAALVTSRAAAQLVAALRFLGQQPEAALARASLAEVWQWALQNWSLALVPSANAVPLGDGSAAHKTGRTGQNPR